MDRKELDKQMCLLQQGDENAFEVIYSETKRGLFSFIFSICKNYHTAEDLMQSAYIKLRASVGGYTPGSNALAWLFTIAKNLTLNELQRRKREVYSEFDAGSFELGHYTIDDKLPGQLLTTIMNTLSESESQIVLLHLVSGYKHREIAEMTGRPLGTVLWAYRNAIQKLQKVLKREEEE
ncbi:MAG: RNA polymerase sigma factor [Clostridiaceae bacterium]|jgi:RNA polymerase sigma-70 factor (ECF subfamily)|nr:RNA polymerase sigma factor [Clostridiaceae bacterium]